MDIVWQAEGSLKEKKTESDLKDVLKTLVAFANSVAPGDTATLYIGERDDGTVQGVTNPDSIQKKVKEIADKIYPEIYYKTTVYDSDGKQCLRIDVKHNGLAPHFGDSAWVRRGSVTIKATEELYQQMVDLRSSRVSTLMKWLNREITVEGTHPQRFIDHNVTVSDPWHGKRPAKLLRVNNDWVTFGLLIAGSELVEKSEPIEKLMISWDDDLHRLKVIVRFRV